MKLPELVYVQPKMRIINRDTEGRVKDSIMSKKMCWTRKNIYWTGNGL